MDTVLKTTPGIAAVVAGFFLLLATVGRIEWRGGSIVSATRWERVLSGVVGVVFLVGSGWAVYVLREPCPPCPPCPAGLPPINVTVNFTKPTTGPIHEDQFEVPLPVVMRKEALTPEEFDHYVTIWDGFTAEERRTLILNSLAEDTPIWVGPSLSPMYWANVSQLDRASFEELLLEPETRFGLTVTPGTCPE